MSHNLNYQYPFNCTWGPANFCSISFTLAIFTLLLLVWTVNLHLRTLGFCMCTRCTQHQLSFARLRPNANVLRLKKTKHTLLSPLPCTIRRCGKLYVVTCLKRFEEWNDSHKYYWAYSKSTELQVMFKIVDISLQYLFPLIFDIICIT